MKSKNPASGRALTLIIHQPTPPTAFNEDCPACLRRRATERDQHAFDRFVSFVECAGHFVPYSVWREPIDQAEQMAQAAFGREADEVARMRYGPGAGIDLAVPFGPHTPSGTVSGGSRTAEAGSDDWPKP